jgi:hypothetical protein
MEGVLVIGLWILFRFVIPFGLIFLLGTLMNRHKSSTPSLR